MAESEDISTRGIFVRTEEQMQVSEITTLALTLPSGEQLQFRARVAHVLAAASAHALGRHVGIGFEFVGDGEFGRLRDHLNAVSGEATSPGVVSRATAAVVAEPSEPLRARIARCLERIGFAVRTYESASDAFVAAAGWKPNVVIAGLEGPGMSGIDLAYAMADHASLATVPLVLTCEHASDLVRLEAYRAGVRDLIPRPFLDEELMIRLHRVAAVTAANSPVGLRGALSDLGLGTMLSLFEFERKSGVLLVMGESDAARLFIADGRILRIEGGGAGVARERLMRVFDWTRGQFEFSAGVVRVADEIGATTTNLLLQHAQRNDEAGR